MTSKTFHVLPSSDCQQTEVGNTKTDRTYDKGKNNRHFTHTLHKRTTFICDKVFKSRQRKFCGRQP